MQAVCERFSPTLQQNGVSFSVTYPDEHFHADVDKEALTKVLSNLLTNANKYTQSRIEVRFQEHPEKQTFSIEVKDNGKGMNEEELKKISNLLSGFREQTGNRHRAQYRKRDCRSTSWTDQGNFPARAWFFIHDYSSSKTGKPIS